MRRSTVRFLLAAGALALAAGGAYAQEQRALVVGMQLEPPMLDPTAGGPPPPSAR